MEQGIFIECSFEMPLEPTDKNFMQFKKENSLHLNVYMVAADEEKCPHNTTICGDEQE